MKAVEIKKYPLKALSEVSKILTLTGYLRQYGEGMERDTIHTFILCPDIYTPEKMTVDLVEANCFEKGYAVMPESQVNIVYLTSILNSAVSWAVMTDGKLEERAKILLKNLKNVLVRVLPAHEQQSVAYLQYLIFEMKRQKNEGGNKPYIDYWSSKYHEAMNAIALELVMPQVYGEYEIDVLGSWLRLIRKCSAENLGTDWNHLHEIIGNEMLAPQNEVTGNLNKLRVVIHDIIERRGKQ